MPIVILNNVRLSYPDLWKPGKPMNEGDTPKFGGQFIFDPNSPVAAVAKKAFMDAAQEEFGQNWQAIVGAMEKSKKCIRVGNENLDNQGNIRDGYKDHLYLVARNKTRPAVIAKGFHKGQPVDLKEDGSAWQNGQPVEDLPFQVTAPYGGCYVNAKVQIRAMKAKDKIPNQVYATLLAVQFIDDGEAFSGAPATAEGFEDQGGGSTGDPFASGGSAPAAGATDADPFATGGSAPAKDPLFG